MNAATGPGEEELILRGVDLRSEDLLTIFPLLLSQTGLRAYLGRVVDGLFLVLGKAQIVEAVEIDRLKICGCPAEDGQMRFAEEVAP